MKKLIIPGLILLNSIGGVLANHFESTKKFFDGLDKNHLGLVDEFYDLNALFQDPVHKVQGIEAIRNYYKGLYENVQSIRFEYLRASEVTDLVSFEWRMYLKTSSLMSGKEIIVEGTSFITFKGTQGKAISHRDYFDMGELVYERVPVLGSIISLIKRKMIQ